MALDESHSRHADRCENHPSKPAVAACNECGKSLCISCAIPVRGEVLGPECVEARTGVPAEQPTAEERARFAQPAAAVGFGVLVVSSVLPWSHYGLGSGAFGAWGTDVRWASAALTCGLIGCVVWIVDNTGARRGRTWAARAEAILAAVALAASILALIRPPAFSPPWLGPWFAIAGATITLLGSLGAAGRRVADMSPLS
jgi:hypothetical protein